MNIQISLNETKEFTLVLFDSVTNQPVSGANVAFQFAQNSDYTIATVVQGSLPNKVSITGLKNASITGSIAANVTYTNSIGAVVTEINKMLPITVLVGNPNPTDLRLQ